MSNKLWGGLEAPLFVLTRIFRMVLVIGGSDA
jgi:hypothetical protein